MLDVQNSPQGNTKSLRFRRGRIENIFHNFYMLEMRPRQAGGLLRVMSETPYRMFGIFS